VVLAIPMTWRWKLQTGVGIDFSPAMHWRAPIVARRVENNQGPVVVVVARQPGSPTAQRGAAHHVGRLPRAPAPELAKARGGPRALSASIKGWATRGSCCFFGEDY
jgi:hypothetical protein